MLLRPFPQYTVPTARILDLVGTAPNYATCNFADASQSYTDVHTGVTHIFARQLLNGLEVSDGDINLNIDRDGRVLSFGNSFHPGDAPTLELTKGTSGETERVCRILKETLESHKQELAATNGEPGPWGLVKAAAQVVLGGTREEQPLVDKHEIGKIHKTMRHVNHHINALCDGVHSTDDKFLTPVEALLHLLPRVSPLPTNMRDAFALEDFYTTPQHSLVAKEAPSEPPTLVISGDGLVKHGVVDHVPARLMYTQISDGAPRLVWKLEVEMKDSWYESYVDSTTGELLRIVDWASDYSWDSPSEGSIQKGGKQKPQKPLPVPPKKLDPYTYQVFPWGE